MQSLSILLKQRILVTLRIKVVLRIVLHFSDHSRKEMLKILQLLIDKLLPLRPGTDTG